MICPEASGLRQVEGQTQGAAIQSKEDPRTCLPIVVPICPFNHGTDDISCLPKWQAIGTLLAATAAAAAVAAATAAAAAAAAAALAAPTAASAAPCRQATLWGVAKSLRVKRGWQGCCRTPAYDHRAVAQQLDLKLVAPPHDHRQPLDAGASTSRTLRRARLPRKEPGARVVSAIGTNAILIDLHTLVLLQRVETARTMLLQPRLQLLSQRPHIGQSGCVHLHSGAILLC
mmetsp:Transcript_41017/g.104290  ORF Transcript_41017/g.104290 Transcript_41017/m.104290 type:complete len:230 (+) Transcript_41017:241-930(+)